jgi:3-mercaptopyruvate sulfurtransferase SseA
MRFILSTLIVFTLGLGVLTACQDSSAPLKTEATNTNISPVPKAAEPAPQDDAPRITLADAKKEFDADKAIFIDTRSADAFKLERIKGAINITMNDSEARYKEIPKDKKIIVYCS